MSTDFETLQKAFDDARDALDAAINKEFPVGSQVRVRVGRGWMHGRVAFDAEDGRLKIYSQNGPLHHKHYSDVEHETYVEHKA